MAGPKCRDNLQGGRVARLYNDNHDLARRHLSQRKHRSLKFDHLDRAAMGDHRLCEMGVEHGGDASDQELRAVANGESVVGHRHDTVRDQTVDP